ncbi:hypothetical protein IFM89_006551 [Coptis chinensis]|uniref:HECT-type E3 ubiquitin transferase n=1 Tax=Coptis chinensis TaxID=261450 RepID=A0A835ILF5_9MAGN|nr:hypothetical protein IFM89_006551 [Coptis chinensis]
MGLLQVAVYIGASKVDCQRHSGFGAVNVPSLPATEEPGDSQQHASIANVDSCQELDKSIYSEIPAPAIKRTVDKYYVFLKLPEPDLQNLCRLLAREGLSNKVYLLAAGGLKKMASVASPHRKFFISELAGLAHGLSTSAIGELITLKCTHIFGPESLVPWSGSYFTCSTSTWCIDYTDRTAVDANKALDEPFHSPQDNANVTAREVKESVGVQPNHASTKFGGALRDGPMLRDICKVCFEASAPIECFHRGESSDATFQPNPNSVYQTKHLSYFKFVGRVVAKALFDGQLLDIYFTRSFYKHILGAKVTYHDIEAVDPDYYKNLKWMLENDVSDIPNLTFSMDADEEKHILYEKTEVTDYELIPRGRNISEVVKAFNKEDMARFLQFVTGTSKVPLEGFKALQGSMRVTFKKR